MKTNPHRGSSFDDFLEEEGILEECTAEALKEVLAWQLQEYMDTKRIKKVEFAKELKTSRSQLDRMLDPKYTKLNLDTLAKAARVMGKHLQLSFV